MVTKIVTDEIVLERATKYWDALGEWQQHSAIAPNKLEILQIFAMSHFVATQCTSHPQWLVAILENQWHLHEKIDDAKQDLIEKLTKLTQETDLFTALRVFRQQQFVALTWRDLFNRQTIESAIQQTSLLADSLIMLAYDWLYEDCCQRFGSPEERQPMLILGMGKLGGHELNFSSDIDLIFCYPNKGMTGGARRSIEHQQFFTKLAQRLISALNKVTAYGQVFRVDMRLRPFGDSGPLVLHFSALEDYYQEQGRQWERFAMMKARVLNPPSEYRQELEQILRPFVFRRYLDFTTIDALREMKQLIVKEVRRRGLDDNIKLGAGGIREVEFFVQSFQLIHGGREPALQRPSLIYTLEQLVSLKLLDTDAAQGLLNAYFFLRKSEQTLQQLNDQQTQQLPTDVSEQHILAAVQGCDNYADYLNALAAHRDLVHNEFIRLVEERNEHHEDDDSLFECSIDAWQISMDESEFAQLFSAHLNQEQAQALHAQVQNYRDIIDGAPIGQRGEDSVKRLIPEIIYIIVEQYPQSITTLCEKIMVVIKAILGRTTYLDLLVENNAVLQQLCRLCDASGWISEQVARFPLLLDELLSPAYLRQQQTDRQLSAIEYRDELRRTSLRIDPSDTEQVMEHWRQFKLAQQLRIAASDITGSLPVAKVSDKLTVLAEVLLDEVCQQAWREVTQRFGAPNHLKDSDRGLVVIGYGKLGGIELGYGSDLDLVFLHNAPQESVTDGARSVSAQQFYIKLAQRIMHLLNTKTLFGQLFETDLRLRPSGNAGLLCCHINGFVHYQQNEAWMWEHQALVRARPIVGDEALMTEFQQVRETILRAPRDMQTVAKEVAEMRSKMRQHLLKNDAHGVDLKQSEGGITDIEFMTQFWVLAYAHVHPELTQWTDNLRILDDIAAAGIIDAQAAQTLQQAYLSLRNQYHHLTLAGENVAATSEELTHWLGKVTTQWKATLGDVQKPSPDA